MLMRFSYKKGLSEEWYSQRIFWINSFVIYAIAYLYAFVIYDFYDAVRFFTDFAKIVLIVILLIMMCKTKKRTVERPRIGLTVDLEKIGGNNETGLINIAEHSGDENE